LKTEKQQDGSQTSNIAKGDDSSKKTEEFPKSIAKPEPKERPPDSWAEAAAIVFAVSGSEGQEQVKPVAMATAVDAKRFVTRALPILSTGVKDPKKDETKLVLAGAFGRRNVVKMTYHPSLPLANLAEGKLGSDDYLTMMLHDASCSPWRNRSRRWTPP